MRLGGRAIPNSVVVLAAGVAVFAVGVAVLHLNPYWHLEPHSTGAIDHRALLCSEIGHLITGVGLLCGTGGATVAMVLLLGSLLRPKKLYWSIVILATCLTLAWLLTSGLSAYYRASFHWGSAAGATVLSLTTSDRDFPNPLWRTIVRWQIEPDLNGYCSLGGTLDSTDGAVTITVVRIVPIVTAVDLGADGESLRNIRRKHPQPDTTNPPSS
jgi:hypothetical protein